MMPAQYSEISSILSTPARFSIFAMTSIFSPPLASRNSRISIMSSFRDTKEAATKSISFLMPKIRSFLSCSLKKSPCMTLFGKFIDFWLERTPPTTTSQITSEPLISFTSRITSPLLIRTLSPGLSCWGSILYVTDTRVSSPSMSSVVRTNVAPSLSSTFPSLKVLILYSGPFVSSMIAIGRFIFVLTLLMRSIFSWCCSCVPCEKLSLATFIPASNILDNVSSLSEAGPIVQIILVLRIYYHLLKSHKKVLPDCIICATKLLHNIVKCLSQYFLHWRLCIWQT